jgi:hypothetical protein
MSLPSDLWTALKLDPEAVQSRARFFAAYYGSRH